MDEIDVKIVQELLNSGSLELGAIQNAICLPILQRIYKKMKLGIEFDNIRVKDSRIVDGHHRYVCSILSKTEIGMNEWAIPSTVVDYDWSEIEIVEIDYETEDQIKKHNERDAKINGVSISIFNDL